MPTNSEPPVPYKIATLCYLFDPEDRLLLLHRRRPPNIDRYSPIGGKLEQAIGESPTTCAQREIREETGLDIPIDKLHLTGIVSESAFAPKPTDPSQTAHWLMFLFEVTRPIDHHELAHTEFDEGTLAWHTRDQIANLPQPETDKKVIWPLFWQHRQKFFAAHIDCNGPEMTWRLEQKL